MSIILKALWIMCIIWVNLASIIAMDKHDNENTAVGEYAETYTLVETEWPLQTVRQLNMNDAQFKATFYYFIPLVSSLKPIIGSIHCNCSNGSCSGTNERHRLIMVSAFKTILRTLAANGYKEVQVATRLLQQPPCLVDFLKKIHGGPRTFEDEYEFITTITPHV